MQDLIAETTTIQKKVAKLWEVAEKVEANVAAVGSLQEEVLVVKKGYS